MKVQIKARQLSRLLDTCVSTTVAGVLIKTFCALQWADAKPNNGFIIKWTKRAKRQRWSHHWKYDTFLSQPRHATSAKKEPIDSGLIEMSLDTPAKCLQIPDLVATPWHPRRREINAVLTSSRLNDSIGNSHVTLLDFRNVFSSPWWLII